MDVNVPPTNHITVLDGQGWIGLLNTMGAEVDITNAARVSFGKKKEKFDDADVLTYQIIGEKVPAARFVFIFVLNGEKPLLNDFRIMLPKPKEAAPAK